MNYFIVVFFLLLCLQCKAKQVSKKNIPLLKTILCGSWIVSEHKSGLFEYINEDNVKYHQINVTLSDDVNGYLISEVDVISGDIIKPLYIIDANKTTKINEPLSLLSTSFHTTSTIHFNEISDSLYISYVTNGDETMWITIAPDSLVQISISSKYLHTTTIYTGKRIPETIKRSFFERFGGIGVSILAILLLVVQTVFAG